MTIEEQLLKPPPRDLRELERLGAEFAGRGQPLFRIIAKWVAAGDAGYLRRLYEDSTGAHEILNNLVLHDEPHGEFVDAVGLPFTNKDTTLVHALRVLAGLGLSLVEESRDEHHLRTAVEWHAHVRASLPDPYASPWQPHSDHWRHDGKRLGRLLDVLSTTKKDLTGPAATVAVTLTTLAGHRIPTGPTLGPQVLLDLGHRGQRARLAGALANRWPRGLVPHPRRMALFTTDPKFQSAFSRAWDQAADDLDGLVLWSMECPEGPIRDAFDDSLGAAFAVMLDELRRRRSPARRYLVVPRLGSDVAVVGAIDDRGYLCPVGGYENKLSAAGKHTRVIVPLLNEEEAGRVADNAAIIPAEHWRTAAKKARRLSYGPVITWIAIVLVLVVGVALWILNLKAQESEARRLRALSREAMSHSDDLRAANPVLAGLVATAAWQLSPTDQARYGMVATTATSIEAVLGSHTDKVSQVAYSPNGETVASASEDGTILLWHVAKRRAIGRLSGHTDKVLTVAFSPDGKTLASGGEDAKTRLWDLASRRLVGVLTHRNWVSSVAFAPDGKTLATGNGDATARLWDVEKRRPIGGYLEGHVGHITSMTFSPDGKLLATGGFDSTVRLWDPATRRQLGEPIQRNLMEIRALAFSPDGKILASASLDDTVRFWNVTTRDPMGKPLEGDTGSFRTLAFSPDGQTLATDGPDNSVTIWDLATRRPLGASLQGHTDRVASVTFSPDGKTLVTGGFDASIRLWNPTAWRPSGARLTSRTRQFHGVAYHPDGKVLAIADGPDAVLWDLVTDRQRARLPHEDIVNGVAFSPDGNMLATAGRTGVPGLWDIATGRRLDKEVPDPSNMDRKITFNPDGAVVVTGGSGRARLWSAENGRPLGARFGHGVLDVAVSPDGSTLATANSGGIVQLWDMSGERAPRALRAHAANVSSVVFSPDGKILASASGQDKHGKIRLWNAETLRPIGDPLAGDLGFVAQLAISPDSRTIAATDTALEKEPKLEPRNDGTVHLWDIATQRRLGAPIPNDGGLITLAFSPDGKTLAGTSSSAVTLWTVSLPKDPVASVCRIAGRSLTREEWRTYIGAEPFRKICP